MGKISLRHYNEEIDVLIDEGNYKTAIEYSKHILTIYPKHADTYRLLGKAFLESERFTDAIDIFQRLLSCIPNDYIAHIGMSVIREDEANLDAAIFHMERAYEVQPTNQTLLKELKRLYGLRDGIEPSKLRLTTGALAKMYAHGDLYSQAIAELLTALVEDDKRPDLMILLAEMYYKSNQIDETIEVCKSILENLPYCFVANDLLARISIQENRETESLEYLSRLYEIDPYIKYSDFPNENPNDVLADEVLLDSYEFHFSDEEDEEDYQPIELHNTEELLINDWQNSFAEQINEQEIESLESQVPVKDMSDDLPDWLQNSDVIKNQINDKDNDDLDDESETFNLFNSLTNDNNLEKSEEININNDDIELDNWMDELKEPSSISESENGSGDESDWLKQLGAIGEYSDQENSDDIENDSEFNLDSFLTDFDKNEEPSIDNENEPSLTDNVSEENDDSDWLNNIMNLSSDDNENINGDSLEEEIESTDLNEELKGIVDEGNEAEEWLNSMAAISDEEFNNVIDEVQDDNIPFDKTPSPVKSANLDWLDEMKKEAVASGNSQKSSEDALNLLGDLGILDDIELENESESAYASNKDSSLSWMDELNDKESLDHSEKIDENEEVSEERNLSESLSWLDSLADGGEISDDSLILDEDDSDDIELVGEKTSNGLSDLFDNDLDDDEDNASAESNLSESLSWLDSLADGGEISDDSLMLDEDDSDEIELVGEKASNGFSDLFDNTIYDEGNASTESNLSESLSWLDSLADGGEISDDSLMLDKDDSKEFESVSEKASDGHSDLFENTIDDEEIITSKESNLSESLSWLDSLAEGEELSDEDLISENKEELSSVNTENTSTNEDLSWLSELDNISDGDKDLDIEKLEFNKDETPLPSTIIEEDEEQIYTNSKSPQSELSESLAWLDSLNSDNLSNDQLISSDKNERIPATIIEETLDEENIEIDIKETEFSDNNDLSWLEELEDQSESSPNISDSVSEDTIEIIEENELEKLQDTASWKNSLTTDEDYSEEDINIIEEKDENYKAYIEESPDIDEVVKTTSNSSWLNELENRSVYDESAEADTDWLAQLEDDESIDPTDESYSLEKSLNEGINWVDDINLEKSQPVSNNLSEEIPEWLSALSVAENSWDESSNEELSRLAENTSAAWAPEFSTKEIDEEGHVNEKNIILSGTEKNESLDSIKTAIDKKEINIALTMIVKLIHKNESIDELIQIMEDLLPHDPMNISLLQTLGDAELKSNRLEKAMEYFTKAEKLIR